MSCQWRALFGRSGLLIMVSGQTSHAATEMQEFMVRVDLVSNSTRNKHPAGVQTFSPTDSLTSTERLSSETMFDLR